MLIITGRSQHDEVDTDTKMFDLVKWIRTRHLQWIGHILGMDNDSLVKDLVRLMYDSPQKGHLLVNSLATDIVSDTWGDLYKRVEHRDMWRQRHTRSY